MIKPLKEFPLMSRYKKVFPDIDENTVIAYDGDIYSNKDLPDHLLIHEEEHLRQQEEIGLEKWVEQFLFDVNFRLNMEIHAYQVQIKSVKDRNKRYRIAVQSAELLASSLYGNIININDALKLITK